MNKKIALSIEQMMHLEELGLDTSDASMCWVKDYKINKEFSLDIFSDVLKKFYIDKENFIDCIPAYTLQDIIENLPEYIMENVTDGGFEILGRNELISRYLDFNNLLDSAYNLLVMCLENHYDKDRKQWKTLEVSSTDE